MKMKKRLVGFAMAFMIFLTSLIGCESQSVMAASLPKEAERTKTEGALSYTFGLTSTEKLVQWVNNTADESMKQVLIDFIQAEYQFTMTRESVAPLVFNCKLAMKKAGSDQVIPITTLIREDNTYYINMEEMRECLHSFETPFMSLLAGSLTTKEAYLKLADEELNMMLGSYEDTETAPVYATDKEYLEYEKASLKFVEMINENFQNAMKDISPAPLYKEEGKVTLSINTGNYEAVVNNFCEDIIKNKERYIDQYISIFENISFYKEDMLVLKANKQEALDIIQEFCEELMTVIKENKLKDTDGLNFIWEEIESGTEENIEITSNINFYIKLIEADMELGYYIKAKSQEDITDLERVAAPEKSVTLNDHLNSLYKD